MKILIVEDQESLAKLLKLGFKKEGYAADYITDGEAAQRRIEMCHKDYDIIILDLFLPKKNGFDICKEARATGISTPILVLTAKGELTSKVSLFDVGADDYMVKPFEFKELLARVRALVRRPKKVLPEDIIIADLVLNPATRKVFRAGKEINLTLKEFRILEYLMRHSGQAVSREDIMSNIWDFDFDSFSNVLDVFINKIRFKLDRGRTRKLIKTIRGIGYKLAVS